MADPVIICETPTGCTCGAPADTPRGMHHCDCAISLSWCGSASCRACSQHGKVTEGGEPR